MTKWTNEEKAQIALAYFRQRSARCPLDGALLQIMDITSDGDQSATIAAHCPQCGNEMNSGEVRREIASASGSLQLSGPLRFTDGELMQLAVDLARKCVGEVGKVTPKVGAVVAREGVVIGTAFRGELKPGEHAEFTLLERKLASTALAGATLFATLEPCTSRNDPKIPCANRIVERKITKVFIGALDPNPNISGRGERLLRAANIETNFFHKPFRDELEELNREFTRHQEAEGRRSRSDAQLVDPVEQGQTGPNGHRIGYTEEGDKVEWLPDEESPGQEWALILRRNDKAIQDAYNEFWDKVWYNRHRDWIERLESGQEELQPGQEETLEQAKRAARHIERKYPGQNLRLSGYEIGLLTGRMSALAWVHGAEWKESSDT